MDPAGRTSGNNAPYQGLADQVKRLDKEVDETRKGINVAREQFRQLAGAFMGGVDLLTEQISRISKELLPGSRAPQSAVPRPVSMPKVSPPKKTDIAQRGSRPNRSRAAAAAAAAAASATAAPARNAPAAPATNPTVAGFLRVPIILPGHDPFIRAAEQVSAQPVANQSSELSNKIHAGATHLQRKDYDAAIAEFNEVISDPQFDSFSLAPCARIGRALAHYLKKDLQAAYNDAIAVISKTQNPIVHLIRGDFLRIHGKPGSNEFVTAKLDLDTAIRSIDNPRQTNANSRDAEIIYHFCVPIFRNALRVSALFSRAELHVENESFDEALKDLSTTLPFGLNLPVIYCKMGKINRERDRLELALECYRNAEKLAPNDASIKEFISKIEVDLQRAANSDLEYADVQAMILLGKNLRRQ